MYTYLRIDVNAAISAINNTDEDKKSVLNTVVKMVDQVKSLTPKGPRENNKNIDKFQCFSYNL
jgi:hypothetical protein